jgi:hypothetical protein
MSMIDMNYQAKLIQPYYPSITEAPILDLHVYLIILPVHVCRQVHVMKLILLLILAWLPPSRLEPGACQLLAPAHTTHLSKHSAWIVLISLDDRRPREPGQSIHRLTPASNQRRRLPRCRCACLRCRRVVDRLSR